MAHRHRGPDGHHQHCTSWAVRRRQTGFIAHFILRDLGTDGPAETLYLQKSLHVIAKV